MQRGASGVNRLGKACVSSSAASSSFAIHVPNRLMAQWAALARNSFGVLFGSIVPNHLNVHGFECCADWNEDDLITLISKISTGPNYMILGWFLTGNYALEQSKIEVFFLQLAKAMTQHYLLKYNTEQTLIKAKEFVSRMFGATITHSTDEAGLWRNQMKVVWCNSTSWAGDSIFSLLAKKRKRQQSEAPIKITTTQCDSAKTAFSVVASIDEKNLHFENEEMPYSDSQTAHRAVDTLIQWTEKELDVAFSHCERLLEEYASAHSEHTALHAIFTKMQ